jgi:hypothetical protein
VKARVRGEVSVSCNFLLSDPSERRSRLRSGETEGVGDQKF